MKHIYHSNFFKKGKYCVKGGRFKSRWLKHLKKSRGKRFYFLRHPK